MSPFIVLVAVFTWAALWGIAGAFIGVPVVIAALCFCEQFPGSQMDLRTAVRPQTRRGRRLSLALRITLDSQRALL